MEPAPHPTRSRPVPATCLFLVLGLTAAAACGSDAAKEGAIRELAVGSWACAPDADGAEELPFTVQIEDDGTFGVSVEPDSIPEDVVLSGDEISGTWAIEDGALEWGFDDVQATERTLVEGFDALTLDSTGFTLKHSSFFEPNDGTDDPPEEQNILVDTHGTDSVRLSVPGGEPWTCDRQ